MKHEILAVFLEIVEKMRNEEMRKSLREDDSFLSSVARS